MTDFDFITLGSATLDVFVETDKQQEVLKISHPSFEESLLAYPLGSKILIKDIEYRIGGGGTNSAVALSLLGNKVGYLGNLGNDMVAKEVIKKLEEYGVKFIGDIKKGKSGYSVILDSFKNDRTVLTFKGVNNDSLKEMKYTTKAVYSSTLMDNALKSQVNLFKKLKRNNVKIFYNPSSYISRMGFDHLKILFETVDVLIFNLEEARELLQSNKGAFELLKDLEEYFEVVIITNGSEGAYLSNKMRQYFIKAHDVKVVETTGAGDAFGSTFSALYLKTHNIIYSLKGAMINAESVIQKKGAKEGLLDIEKLHKKIVSSKFKIIKR